MKKLITSLFLLLIPLVACATIFIQTTDFLFSDYFTTDTTGDYTEIDTWGTAGVFSYDGTNDRAEIVTNDNTGLAVTQAVTSATNGTFSILFRPHTINSGWGFALFKIRLLQDDNNYYEVCYVDDTYADNTDCDGLYKYVDKDDANWDDKDASANYYSQDTDYTVVINFSPTETTVTGFGETLTIDTETTSLAIDTIYIEMAQQEGYIDNIEYGL